MNERFQELARQANFTDQDIEDMSPGFEKFAQLLVIEVADRCFPFDDVKFQNILNQFGVE